MTGHAFGWLVRDVFLRARASGFQAALLVATCSTAAFCLTATYDGQALNLLFGVAKIAGPDVESAARDLLFLIAFGIAELVGVAVVLVGTAAFLPVFLEPASATILLSKPPSRATMLMGRIIGVLAFVTLHSTLFVAATAIAVGVRTGVWLPAFWIALPLLLVQFFAFFGFSTLIAVSTHSTVAAMLAGIVFWIISWGIGIGRHLLTGITLDGAAPAFGRMVDYVYAVLPKPADFSLMLHESLGIAPDGLASVGLRAVRDQGLYSPTFAVVSSLLLGIALFALAVYELENQDY